MKNIGLLLLLIFLLLRLSSCYSPSKLLLKLLFLLFFFSKLFYWFNLLWRLLLLLLLLLSNLLWLLFHFFKFLERIIFTSLFLWHIRLTSNLTFSCSYTLILGIVLVSLSFSRLLHSIIFYKLLLIFNSDFLDRGKLAWFWYIFLFWFFS